MAESSLMLPIAGVFLVACVSGIMRPGGDVNKLQRGSVVVVTNDIKKTSDLSSKVLGVFQGQYVQDGNETIRVTASATIFADSENPYNTTYEVRI
ncbi:unnamed protein product [Sphagnum troendelagicum]